MGDAAAVVTGEGICPDDARGAGLVKNDLKKM
jgi:hypothetical protein